MAHVSLQRQVTECKGNLSNSAASVPAGYGAFREQPLQLDLGLQQSDTIHALPYYQRLGCVSASRIEVAHCSWVFT